MSHRLTVRQGSILIHCEAADLRAVILSLRDSECSNRSGSQQQARGQDIEGIARVAKNTVDLALEVQHAIAEKAPDDRVKTLADAIGCVRKSRAVTGQDLKRLQHLNIAASWLRHCDGALVSNIRATARKLKERALERAEEQKAEQKAEDHQRTAREKQKAEEEAQEEHQQGGQKGKKREEQEGQEGPEVEEVQEGQGAEGGEALTMQGC